MLFSNDVCKDDSPPICDMSKNFKCENLFSVIQNEQYEIFAKCEKTPEIFINGEILNFENIFDNVYKSNIKFHIFGKNRIEVYFDKVLHGYFEFEVLPKVKNTSKNISNMLLDIGKYADCQLVNFLKTQYKDTIFANSVSDAFDELFAYVNEILKSIRPRHFLPQRKEKYLRPRKKHIFSFKSKNSTEKKFKKYKILDVYNTKSNINLKTRATEICETLKNLTVFFPYFEKRYTELSNVLSSYPLNKIQCKTVPAVKFCGNFFKADVDLIYKFWCFVKISEIFSQFCKVLKRDVFEIDKNVFLADINNLCETRFVNTKTDTFISVKYNPKPDYPCIFVSIKTNGEYADCITNYAFDAKYKTIPENNDILRCHAYSDTILSRTTKHRILSKCMLLYFGEKSDNIENAIAFSPNLTESMKKFFENIVFFEDKSVYKNIISNFETAKFGDKNVLVGVVKTKTQFEINISKKFYYIPQRFIEKTDIKYIALYQSKSLFACDSGIKYYGEVKKVTLAKRDDIKEIPKESPELYYRFDIKEWLTLENPIKSKNFAEVCMYTNIFLLKNAKILPELYISSRTEFILYSCIKDFWNKSEICGFEFFLNYLKFEKETVSLYTEKGFLVKFKKATYNSDLILLTKEIIRIIS